MENVAVDLQPHQLTALEKKLEIVNIAAYTDKWGPEKIIGVYDPDIGMEGILCIDNTALGPGIGRIRIQAGVTPVEVFQLARMMTWKCALANLPFGGAKAGINTDPFTIDKRKYVKAFARAINVFCPSQWVAAPGMNTGEKEIAVFVEEIGDLKVATGKPERLGGIPHELGTIGFGIGVSIETALEVLSPAIQGSLLGLKVVIQGFGKIGAELAKYLANKGAMIVGISDYWGAAYNSKGIDISKALKHAYAINEKQSIKKCKNTTEITRDALLYVNCDVLVLTTISEVITAENADQIKAKLVVESDYTSITDKAELMLFRRGVLVLPDLLVNSGGVIGSYVEYLGLGTNDAFAMIDSKIMKNTKQVLDIAMNSKTMVLPKIVAMKIAMNRVSKAMRQRTSSMEL